jgi:hypothetical protein
LVSLGSLEITVKNKVLTRIFSMGTIYLTDIPEESKGTILYWELVARKKAPSRNTCKKYGSPGYLANNT